MNANSTVPEVVEGGGEQVVAHVGLHALGSLADRLGLGSSLSARISQPRFRLHDRGKVLTRSMLMLAGGGEACSDIERLRSQPTLFGMVPLDSTLYRTVRSVDAETLAGMWDAMGETRGEVLRRSSATTGTAPVVLDLDASLVDIHSENKEGTGWRSGRALARWRRRSVGTAAMVPWFPVRGLRSVTVDRVHSVSSAPPSNRACGSPAHGSPTSFTGGVRQRAPARPGWVWGRQRFR